MQLYKRLQKGRVDAYFYSLLTQGFIPPLVYLSVMKKSLAGPDLSHPMEKISPWHDKHELPALNPSNIIEATDLTRISTGPPGV